VGGRRPPPLTELLQAHLAEFGTAADGRLVRGVRGNDLSDSTYGRAWKKARELALTPEEAASLLARRPYDLRHAAVSTEGVDHRSHRPQRGIPSALPANYYTASCGVG
jgi:hypothetical protein